MLHLVKISVEISQDVSDMLKKLGQWLKSG